MSESAIDGACDAALQVPHINLSPGPEYETRFRHWQGIPGIERASNGRLWATWYSGGVGEGPLNHIVLVTSDDDGQSWSSPRLAIDPPGDVRVFDPVLWIDPPGRLWLFWSQSVSWFDGRGGVWAICCSQPGSAVPTWSPPQRICHGVMMNKPTVRLNGDWLLPAAVWTHRAHLEAMARLRKASVVVSTDQGQSFEWRDGLDVPNRTADEHMAVELRDGTLWMLVRRRDGIAEGFSGDGGYTWSSPRMSKIKGPGSRFFIRRLRSGRLLLINHHNFAGRNNMTALLSDDDGRTWPASLLLDERTGVSYPDAVEADDGRIYAIHDFDRRGSGQILMSVFTEADILAGDLVSAGSRRCQVVDQLRPEPD